jgi:hypothetical protein
MNINIDVSRMNNFFLINQTEHESNSINKKNRHKIVNYTNYMINEIKICEKIKKIMYYSNYFSILQDYEPLNISLLNEDILEKLDKPNEIQYYLFEYNDKNNLDFIDFLYNSQNIKKLIFDIINSFKHILKGLSLLNENNLCFFDLRPQKILYLENYREKPVLSDFKLSLNINKLNYEYISNLLNKIEDFTYLPFEIHVLFYFIKNNIVTISYSFIEEFCENYMENLNILRLFSKEYKITYKNECIKILQKYINKPKDQIINDILERNDKWDIYGISILYLQIFGCIFRVFSLKGTFMSKIIIELSKNINPNSEKRMNIETTLEIFNNIIDEQNDWKFINNLDNKKLSILFDELSK